MRFIELADRALQCPEPIYEFGSLQVAGQEGEGDLRPIFQPRRFVGCDLRQGLGVDEVRDVCDTGLPDASVGTAIMADTLEHVERPWDALAEMERILRPDGLVLLTTVMNFPIHDHPHDYWRFTPEAIASLLKPFSTRWVGWLGDEDFPVTLLGIGAKGPLDLAAFSARYDPWWQSEQRWHEALKAAATH